MKAAAMLARESFLPLGTYARWGWFVTCPRVISGSDLTPCRRHAVPVRAQEARRGRAEWIAVKVGKEDARESILSNSGAYLNNPGSQSEARSACVGCHGDLETRKRWTWSNSGWITNKACFTRRATDELSASVFTTLLANQRGVARLTLPLIGGRGCQSA